jgi:hypothetical protein
MKKHSKSGATGINSVRLKNVKKSKAVPLHAMEALEGRGV